MRKPTLNFWIDAVAFVAFVLLAATGILVRYVLPPGSGHFATLWGLDRHQWGEIHFWLAVSMLAALVLHVFLHWRWIVAMVRGSKTREGSGVRLAMALVGILGLAALAAAPFLAPVDTSGEPPHRMRSDEPGTHTAPEISGSMTLGEVAASSGVPVEVLLRELELPEDVSADQRLGHLRRQYGFELSAVRAAVRKHAGK
ncbi:MAG: DUF4405 domain-containing protein [Planctomycetes bacterium]|nr:DUF4405 domain-containing protein [Planctomycetota bacterium]